MRNGSSLPAARTSVALCIVGLVAAGFSPAAGAGTLRKDEISATSALGAFLYSPPVADSMRKCVGASEARRSEEIRAAIQRAADLPTKSGQQQEIARNGELKKAVPFSGRAECMLMALWYLERLNSSLTATTMYSDHPRIVPDEVTRTTGDLSAAGLRELSAALESNGAALESKGAGHSMSSNFERLFDVLYFSLQSCFHVDELNVPGSSPEEVWEASCRLAELTGLSTAGVSKPEFPQGVLTTSTAIAGHRITPPVRKRSPVPEYPPASRRAGEAGTVQFKVYVLADGKPGEVTILRSSGFDKLDVAAVRGVQRDWWFVPGTEDGKPVAMWSSHALTFGLR